MADKSRYDYEQLRVIAGQFSQASSGVHAMRGTLRDHVGRVQSGVWVGVAADAFVQEMQTVVLPSVLRLAEALGAAQQSTQLLITAVQSAERDAAAVLKHVGVFAPGQGVAGGGPGMSPVSLGSDYLRDVVLGGSSSPAYVTVGRNDATMAPYTNPVATGVDTAVTWLMRQLGYDTTRRVGTDENDFYREYADYMPGYSVDGIPSGAWAQDAATNYTGHGTGPGNPWYEVRKSLVEQEYAMIQRKLAAGGDGKLTFGDLYEAHVIAYRDHSSGNSFIDPASFALAVYAVPALKAIGLNIGPLTGASIDLFNDPTDSATAGWLKRMALSGGEIGVGVALGPIGAPLVVLGVFSAGWNTGTAINAGMLNEVGDGIRDFWNGLPDLNPLW
jgi:WXG100 family type VII secretion target